VGLTWLFLAFEWLSGGFYWVKNGFRNGLFRDKSIDCLIEMGSFVQIHFCLAETKQVADRVAVLEVDAMRVQVEALHPGGRLVQGLRGEHAPGYLVFIDSAFRLAKDFLVDGGGFEAGSAESSPVGGDGLVDERVFGGSLRVVFAVIGFAQLEEAFARFAPDEDGFREDSVCEGVF